MSEIIFIFWIFYLQVLFFCFARIAGYKSNLKILQILMWIYETLCVVFLHTSKSNSLLYTKKFKWANANIDLDTFNQYSNDDGDEDNSSGGDLEKKTKKTFQVYYCQSFD